MTSFAVYSFAIRHLQSTFLHRGTKRFISIKFNVLDLPVFLCLSESFR